MARKNRWFSTSINQEFVDASGLGDLLFDTIHAQMKKSMDDQLFFIQSELEDLLKEIGELSPNRGRGRKKPDYDHPITKKNSPVKITRRYNERTGQFSASIRVDNDKFNILDQGAPMRYPKGEKPMRFPRYTTARTTSNELTVQPTKILDKLKSEKYDPVAKKFIKIGGWVTVTQVEPIKARNFIISVAAKVRRENRNPLIKIRVRRNPPSGNQPA